MIRRYWDDLGNTLVMVLLLTGAETGLLYLLSAEMAGSFARAPLGWAGLWALGMTAFFVPRALNGLRPLAYTLLLATAITFTLILVVYLSSYTHRAPWDAGWILDALNAAILRPSTALRSVPLLIVTVIIVWWRQIYRETPGSEAAEFLFRLSPVAVLVLVIGGIAAWGPGGAEIGTLAWRIAASFLLTLLALAYGRWMETPKRGPGARSTLFGWLGSAMLPILLAAGLTIGLSALLFGTVSPVLSFLVNAVLGIVLLLFVAASTVLTWLAWALAQLVRALLETFNLPSFRLRERPASVEDTEETRRELAERALQLPEWATWTAVLLVALLVLWALTRYGPRRDTVSGPAVVRESVWEPPEVGKSLRGLLGMFRYRSGDPLKDLLHDPTWRHTAEVRRAYRDVQHLYARHGRGRPPAQTAREHANTQPSEALGELASVYQQARYSTKPAPPELARRARELRETASKELTQ